MSYRSSWQYPRFFERETKTLEYTLFLRLLLPSILRQIPSSANLFSRWRRLVMLTAFVTFLSGCSGGGGGGASAPAPAANVPPAFSSPTAFTFAENELVTFTLTVTDPDSATVTITDDTSGDGALFTVNASSGLVTANTASGGFDFESPQDTNGDNVYEQRVTLSDGRDSVTTTVRVTITNVDEPPQFNDPGIVSLNENATGPLVTFAAVDPEGAAVTAYRISQVEKLGEVVNAQRLLDAFSIDPVSGELSVVTAFDAEVEGTQDRITVSVTTTDGSQEATGSVVIQLVDLPSRVVSGVRLTGQDTVNRLGQFAAPVGDIDQDGFIDVWVAGTTDEAGLESAYLVWGSTIQAEMADGNGDLSIGALGPTQAIRFTYDVRGQVERRTLLKATAAGDVDGDSTPDLLVGFEELRESAFVDAEDGPVAAVIWGNRLAGNVSGTFDLRSLDAADGILLRGLSRYENVQLALAASDLDADGRSDVLLGHPGKNRARIVYGTALNQGTPALDVATATASQALLLQSISTAGSGPVIQQIGRHLAVSNDLDSDGRPEIVISGAGLEPTLEDGIYVVSSQVLAGAYGVATELNLLDPAVAGQVVELIGQDASIAGLSAAGDIDGDGLNDLAIAHTGINGNQLVATLVYGSLLRGALAAGNDPSLVLTSAADGVRVTLTNQIFSQEVGTRINARIVPSIGGSPGADLVIGLTDDSAPGRERSGSVMVLTDDALQAANSADIAFAAGAFPPELGRRLLGLETGARLGAFAFVSDIDGDGLPDLCLASPTAGRVTSTLASGAFFFLPGTLLSQVVNGSSADYDLAEALNSEAP
ncbi:MAG: hypothetical protein ACFHX7_07465 [Pseudomonadota bacterium]